MGEEKGGKKPITCAVLGAAVSAAVEICSEQPVAEMKLLFHP